MSSRESNGSGHGELTESEVSQLAQVCGFCEKTPGMSASAQDSGKSRPSHPQQSRIAAGGSSRTTKSFTGGPNPHGYAGTLISPSSSS